MKKPAKRKPGKFRRMRTLLQEVLNLGYFYGIDVNTGRCECKSCGATMLHYGVCAEDIERHTPSCILSRIRRALK